MKKRVDVSTPLHIQLIGVWVMLVCISIFNIQFFDTLNVSTNTCNHAMQALISIFALKSQFPLLI